MIRKGNETSGEIFIYALIRGEKPRFFGKMPMFDKPSQWEEKRIEGIEKKEEFNLYLQKIINRDPDLWLIELNVSDEQRLVRLLGHNH